MITYPSITVDIKQHTRTRKPPRRMRRRGKKEKASDTNICEKWRENNLPTIELEEISICELILSLNKHLQFCRLTLHPCTEFFLTDQPTFLDFANFITEIKNNTMQFSSISLILSTFAFCSKTFDCKLHQFFL